jgi:hypothetical protein
MIHDKCLRYQAVQVYPHQRPPTANKKNRN